MINKKKVMKRKKFTFTARVVGKKTTFTCYDLDGNVIESPVSKRLLKSSYDDGFMMMVPNTNKSGGKYWNKARKDYNHPNGYTIK